MVEVHGHREFVQWVKENGVEYYHSNHDCWPLAHKEYVGIDRSGQCYLIELYPQAEYHIYPIDKDEALKSLTFSIYRGEFKRLLEERRREHDECCALRN